MASTARFGLTLGANLSDHDKALIDSVLSALELHDHKGGTRLDDPSGPPAGVLSTTGGHLPAGQTFYYRLSYIDQFGLETAASEEVSFTTPTPLDAPAVPTTVVDNASGLLSVGVYYYALSLVDADGNQTGLSTAATTTVVTGNAEVTIGVRPLPDGAVKYQVWRQGPRSSSYTMIGEITDVDTPFIDNGYVPDDPLACDPSTLPPAFNQTNATSMVTFSPADVDLVSAEGGPIKAWRLYRATVSGTYGVNSLIGEVNTTVNEDGTGGLVLSFIDDGTLIPLTGQPKNQSETLHPSVQIVGGGGGNGAVVFPPNTDGTHWRLIAADDGSLAVRLSPGGYYDPDRGNLYLFSPGSATYRVQVTDDGTLYTTAAAPGAGDTVYPVGQGPDLPGPDPTVSWKLGVANDGSLLTTEV